MGGIIDRHTLDVTDESIALGPFFRFMMTNALGRRLQPLVFESRALHRAVERYADSAHSRRLIARFAARAGIDMSEMIVPPGGFKSFNDFFTRRLKPELRPFDRDPNVFASPADSKLQVFPSLHEGARLDVKGVRFTLAELLDDAELASAFEGGAAAIFRLYLADCHRLYFPCDGVPGVPRLVPGAYYSVSPLPGNDIALYSPQRCESQRLSCAAKMGRPTERRLNPTFFTRNQRTVTTFDSARFGRLALVDVGGFLISSIESVFNPGRTVKKGDEKSRFRFGGSTLVVLFPKNRIAFDDDLVRHAAAGYEVRVRIGERVGVSN
ncbi:MAG: phosphatidylserine decarboxylase [Deltaproteobacteria bacterium]|nr:phosphatidylserine decarboxylase [Deltaproteobacteria bacterium]